MKRVALHTLGCKLNQAETSAMGRQFQSAGFEVGSIADASDVVLLNSCTVTETAEVECRKLVRRALRANPDAFVIVTGCYAQLRPEEVASIDGVRLVLGSNEKPKVLELAREAIAAEARQSPELDVPTQVHVSEMPTTRDFGPAFTGIGDGRARAFLKVQDGCDYRCAFCTIPKARGPSRSQPIEEAVRQAQRIVDSGVKEIVLTGVNVGDFGRKTDSSLYELLLALLEVGGLRRLKISSIEPNLLTDRIIDLAASEPRIAPHFHIPLQSGCDRVLRAMRRRYDSSQYRDRIERLVERIPHVGIGADVIVGFPGETEAEFEASAAFITELPVSYLHAFTYSERPDTPAAEWPDQIDRGQRKHRTRLLRQLSDRKRQAFSQRFVGDTRPVLFEKTLADGRLHGLTDNYIRVEIDPRPEVWTGTEPAPSLGTIRTMHLTEWTGELMLGSPSAPC